MKTISEIANLIMLLDKAQMLAGQFTGGYSKQFLSAEEFYEALEQSIKKLKQGDNSELNTLFFWFAPICSWDDFVGMEGMKLGNKIFELLCKIKSRK